MCNEFNLNSEPSELNFSLEFVLSSDLVFDLGSTDFPSFISSDSLSLISLISFNASSYNVPFSVSAFLSLDFATDLFSVLIFSIDKFSASSFC